MAHCHLFGVLFLLLSDNYNGTLEGIQKSWNGPEKQMLAKFIDMQYMYTLQQSTVGNKDDFITLVCKNSHLFKNELRNYGSLHQFALQDVIIYEQLKCHDCVTSMLDATEKSFQSLVPPLKEKCFGDIELSYLRQMYNNYVPISKFQN